MSWFLNNLFQRGSKKFCQRVKLVLGLFLLLGKEVNANKAGGSLTNGIPREAGGGASSLGPRRKASWRGWGQWGQSRRGGAVEGRGRGEGPQGEDLQWADPMEGGFQSGRHQQPC